MFYTIYKITNQVNGKYYIGKHQTKKLNDNYMGSGELLKRAITKYGIENFKKEILHIFDNELEMNAKEKELVLVNESTYNLNQGGHGGFSYINEHGLNWSYEKNCRISNLVKKKETYKKIGHQQGSKNSQYGKPKSEKTKQKIRETLKQTRLHKAKI
jgi:GIY-YIG catalytic domain